MKSQDQAALHLAVLMFLRHDKEHMKAMVKNDRIAAEEETEIMNELASLIKPRIQDILESMESIPKSLRVRILRGLEIIAAM